LILLAGRLVTKGEVVGSALDALLAREAKGATTPEALHGYGFFEAV
jgi:hypothetical protein